MKIKVNLKSIAKRKHSVKPVNYEINGRPSTVRELILAVVDASVRAYNERIDSQELLSCLTKEETDEQAQAGKISFGVNYGEARAEIEQAQENAVQCFEDGIYRIFIDNKPLRELDEAVAVTEESVFTFVRLTFLS